MKKKTLFLLVLLLSISLYFFFSASSYTTNNTFTPVKQSTALYTGSWGNNFIYGAFNSGYDFQFEYDELGFNIWHTYGYDSGSSRSYGRKIPPGWEHPNYWEPKDTLFADYSSYGNGIGNVLTGVASAWPDQKIFLTRAKTEWFRFGQRSTYQCEAVLI